MCSSRLRGFRGCCFGCTGGSMRCGLTRIGCFRGASRGSGHFGRVGCPTGSADRQWLGLVLGVAGAANILHAGQQLERPGAQVGHTTNVAGQVSRTFSSDDEWTEMLGYDGAVAAALYLDGTVNSNRGAALVLQRDRVIDRTVRVDALVIT